MKTWLPSDTREALRQPPFFEPAKCESRSLLLTRMACSAETTDDAAAARSDSLKRAIGTAAVRTFTNSVAWLQQFQPKERLRRFTLYTSERLLLGLANGVHENAGLDLHRFFGVPVITGSKLKGVARDAATELRRDGKLEATDAVLIFGVEDNIELGIAAKAGSVDFLPAYPEQADCRLELDVLTVHYRNYYGNGGTDWDEEGPVPALFPAVAEGQAFVFHLLCRNPRLDDAEAGRLLGLAALCLQHALTSSGVGAKNRGGYGRFRLTPKPATPSPASDDLFVPPPPPNNLGCIPSPVHTTQTTALQPGGNVGQAFIAKWSGDALVPDAIKAFAKQLRELPAAERMKAFDACVPAARRTPNDPLWQAFRSRHHGAALLKELNLA